MNMNFPGFKKNPEQPDGSDETRSFSTNPEAVVKLKQAVAFLEEQDTKVLGHARKLLAVLVGRESPFSDEGAKKLQAVSTYQLLESWYMNFRNEDAEMTLRQFIDRKISVGQKKGESEELHRIARVDKKMEYQRALEILMQALRMTRKS